MAKKHELNSLVVLFNNIADAARVQIVSEAMKDYKDNWSITAPKPMEHLLAKLLGVDTSWVLFFDAVFSGKLHGAMLVGGEDHPGTVLAQAMMVQKHGFIQHPLSNSPMPIHPFANEKIKLSINPPENKKKKPVVCYTCNDTKAVRVLQERLGTVGCPKCVVIDKPYETTK